MSTAILRYSDACYAKLIVILLECKLSGWPPSIPYTSFSNIPGGIPVLTILLELCKQDKIYFESATPEDIANAMCNPATVHPNYRRPGAGGKLSVQAPSDAQDPTVVLSYVLNPEGLGLIGVQPISTQSSAAAALLDVIPSQQRSDVKRPRCRNLDGPYSRPRPLPKEGVKSEPFVLEPATEDRCLESPTSEHQREQYLLVRDPLLEFLPAMPWGALTSFDILPPIPYGGAGETCTEMAMDVFGTVVF